MPQQGGQKVQGGQVGMAQIGNVPGQVKVGQFDGGFLDDFARGGLARLGGHQNRKCDGHPGWLVLWRGWMKLQAMLDGYLAAQRRKCGKS